jgi:hypothetical protein
MRITVHVDRLVLHDLGLSAAELAGLTGRIEAELAALWSGPPAADRQPDAMAGPIARAVAARVPRPGGTP